MTETTQKVQRITQPGTYNVMILKPRWEALESRDGDANRMVAVLPGHTDNGLSIEARLSFTRTIIARGQNAGQPLWKISAEKLHELGMPRPFNPAELEQLHGAICEYVVEVEEYQAESGERKTRTTVRFINTGKREELSPTDATSIWAKLAGGDAGPAAPAAQARTLPAKPLPQAQPASDAPSKEDDLPW